MVGTNRMDYEVALGLSRTFAGHGSDGLVRIENATLCGLKDSGQPGQSCAKAFAYRSHSGYFGIVNSEEAYQNPTRFLSVMRVDIWADVTEIRPPAQVQESRTRCWGQRSYQFEVPSHPASSGISQDAPPKKTSSPFEPHGMGSSTKEERSSI
jgi:hypothetical protein